MIKIEENNVKEQKANGWLVALSILIPLAGLIIFITQKEKQPKTAKTCGICALITFIISIVITFMLLFVVVPTMIAIAEDNGIIKKAQESSAKNYILDAEETVAINISRELTNYMTEKYTSNKNADISKYLIEALKKAKKELKDKEITLTASGNKVYLSSDKYTVTGTVSDNGAVIWSNIEEK